MTRRTRTAPCTAPCTAAFLLALALLLPAPPAAAQDRAEIERTPIVGNRELPKVLYVVPWKKPPPAALAPPPPLPAAGDALVPVDRDVLRRQLRLQPTPSPNVPGDRP